MWLMSAVGPYHIRPLLYMYRMYVQMQSEAFPEAASASILAVVLGCGNDLRLTCQRFASPLDSIPYFKALCFQDKAHRC